MAVARKIGEPYCFRKSRLGPTTPPVPPTWWQTTQRFSVKSRRPTSARPGGSK